MTEEERKEHALAFLKRRPSKFRWSLGPEPAYFRDTLLAAVNREGPFGQTVIDRAQDFMAEPSNSNFLGKRYVCLVCGTEALCNKAGEGNIGCCGQSMEMKVPRPIPSSD